MRKLFVLFILMHFAFLTGFMSDIPVEIEKVNLNLSENELAITFLQLSSGEATLIQKGNGENALINTGGPSTQKELQNLLEMYDVLKFNAIIMTKEGSQYDSNLAWLTKAYLVDEVIIGKNATKLLEKISLNDYNNVVNWSEGEKHQVLHDLSFQILHEKVAVDGNAEMDLLLTYRNHQVLYMSSSKFEVERQLINLNLKDVNILKVAEFANENSTSQMLLEHIDPQAAIIFSKKGVKPSQEVIERLHETWIDIYQTKQFGNVTIKFTDDNYEVITITVKNVQDKS